MNRRGSPRILNKETVLRTLAATAGNKRQFVSLLLLLLTSCAGRNTPPPELAREDLAAVAEQTNEIDRSRSSQDSAYADTAQDYAKLVWQLFDLVRASPDELEEVCDYRARWLRDGELKVGLCVPSESRLGTVKYVAVYDANREARDASIEFALHHLKPLTKAAFEAVGARPPDDMEQASVIWHLDGALLTVGVAPGSQFGFARLTRELDTRSDAPIHAEAPAAPITSEISVTKSHDVLHKMGQTEFHRRCKAEGGEPTRGDGGLDTCMFPGRAYFVNFPNGEAANLYSMMTPTKPEEAMALFDSMVEDFGKPDQVAEIGDEARSVLWRDIGQGDGLILVLYRDKVQYIVGDVADQIPPTVTERTERARNEGKASPPEIVQARNTVRRLKAESWDVETCVQYQRAGHKVCVYDRATGYDENGPYDSIGFLLSRGCDEWLDRAKNFCPKCARKGACD